MTYVNNGSILNAVIDICQKGNDMSRPKRCRRICGYPDYWSFLPEGSEIKETITFMLDELEKEFHRADVLTNVFLFKYVNSKDDTFTTLTMMSSDE